MTKSTSNAGRYQGCMPVTSKNIGKQHVKYRGKKDYPATGAKEAARAAKRLAQQAR